MQRSLILLVTLALQRRYVIEYTDDLSQPWSTLSNGTADGQTLTVQDPAATGDQRFYRLRTVP
jgi:hypothetical protein